MRKILTNCTIVALLTVMSCGNDATNITHSDSLSAKDSVKKHLTEDLPPSTDIKQFEWIYSTFVASAITDVPRFDVFIHPDFGLWVITADGAMPQMKNIKTAAGIKGNDGNNLIPMNRENMVCTPSEDPLPEINCDSKTFWTKEGCFTTETNTFRNEKIWDYAGLNSTEAKKAESMGSEISRVVINTHMNMKFYFTEIDGTWYLTFLDMRKPCQA